MKALIQSDQAGTMMLLPREGGYMVRHYVELEALGTAERAADRGLGIEDIIAKARAIFSPYSFDVKDVVWWSVYEIGHRLTDKFDDVPAAEVAHRSPRVMLAGDACHTHSPKAGQGMNVSMGDTFNLGWKLIAVLTGRADAALLHSYSEERRGAAKALIDFDHQWSRVIGARGAEETGNDLPGFARAFVKNLAYTSGLTIQYAPSRLIGEMEHQALAKGFEIGKRFHSAPVIRLADAKPMHLGHVVQADGRWRLFAFAGLGDSGRSGGAMARLCAFLEEAPDSPVRRHTRADEDIDAVIDLRAVFQQGFRELEHNAMPALLRPLKGRLGLCDYEKVFCADPREGQEIYRLRGIDRLNGCLVVVRPDQHVAHVLPLEEHAALAAFFAGVLLPA
jgi:phenol 2-monooxygenase